MFATFPAGSFGEHRRNEIWVFTTLICALVKFLSTINTGAVLFVDGQRVYHTSGMRKEWFSVETLCSSENVAEPIFNKV